jgi:hypothetical protein
MSNDWKEAAHLAVEVANTVRSASASLRIRREICAIQRPPFHFERSAAC